MKMFLFTFLSTFYNKKLFNNIIYKSTLDDNYENKNKTYISKKYIYNIMNNYIDEKKYNNSYSDEIINNSEYNNFHKANNITNIKTKIKINIMPGINYAYPYENQTENTQNLNNINKNLNLLKYKNILINKNIAESIKLDYANKYLLINETKYNYNIKNGGLYNDWNFTF